MRMTEFSIPIAWLDRRRWLWPISLIVPSLALIAFGLVAMSGTAWFWWTGAVVIYGVVPLLDWWIGEDRNNPPATSAGGLPT